MRQFTVAQGDRPGPMAPEPERARLRPRVCKGCAAIFTPSRSWHSCCSDRCRALASRKQRADRRSEVLERFRPDDPARPE